MNNGSKVLIGIVLGAIVFLTSCTPNNESQITESEPNTTEPLTQIESTEPSVYDLQFKPSNYEYVRAFPNLTFDQPLFLTHWEDQIYVVEKTGKIKYFPNDDTVNEVNVFDDFSDRIDLGGNEKGLLGFAFHPDFKSNGLYFVYYTDQEGSVVLKKSINQEEELVLRFTQPYSNHNGGHLAFGPDGYLYIASGDGGGSGDPDNNSQNKTNLLGKILRIDVDHPTEESTYSIPKDNPFVGNSQGYKEEIFAYGLRNPWRFSFDEKRDLLIAADVGQDKMEEINLIHKGGNYGWRIMEGTQIYHSSDKEGLNLSAPIWTYEHPVGESITGGYVYYGEGNSSLYGSYLYGDFITGTIWGLWIDENQEVKNAELLKTSLKISSFGRAPEGEVLIVDYSGGIYRIVEQE